MATKYFSFNSALPDAENLVECVKEDIAVDDPLPLQYTWRVWEQVQQDDRSRDYAENTRDLAGFDTIQKFWQLWAYVPQPSELLNHKRMVRQDKNGRSHVVDALMIFKDGVRPMWEDSSNSDGGHFDYRLTVPQIGPGQIDEYWNNVVLGMIGGTIDHVEHINGVRLVDKLSQNRFPCIRIEVWFSKCDKAIQEAMHRSLEKCMASKLDGSMGTPLRGDCKYHRR